MDCGVLEPRLLPQSFDPIHRFLIAHPVCMVIPSSMRFCHRQGVFWLRIELCGGDDLEYFSQ